MPTNAQAMRAGKVPCEWNPWKGCLSRLSDGWHGKAALIGGKVSKESVRQDRQLRVCRDCALRPEVERAVATPGRSVQFREID